MDDVDENMIEFLRYVENSTDAVANASESLLVKKLHTVVKKVKANKEMEVSYLQLLDRDEKNRREGREEGRKDGLTLAKTILKLAADGTTEQEIASKLNLPIEDVKMVLSE